MKKITFKVYTKFHGEGQEYNIEAEESDDLKGFLKGFKGMNILYKTFISFARRNNIKHTLLK